MPAVLMRRPSKWPGYLGGVMRVGSGRDEGCQHDAGVSSAQNVARKLETTLMDSSTE